MLKARKEKDTLKVSVLGYLVSEINYKEIALRGKGETLTDENVNEIIEKQIRQRKESIEQYRAGKREDLVEKEGSEMKVLEDLKAEIA